MSQNYFVRDEGIDEVFNLKFTGCYEKSPYAKRIIDVILGSFPNRISENEIAGEIKISIKWLQHECKKAFDVTYIKLVRIIRIYFALKLLHETNLKNKEISLALKYSVESNMARDFKKILKISPKEVRKKLLIVSPAQLLTSI